MLDPRRLGTALALGLLALSRTSAAQHAPYDPAIDVQMFDYAVGPKTFLTVSDADVAAKKQLAVDALLTILTKPFTIYNVDDNKMIAGERVRVVESMTAAQLAAAYGLNDRLQLGVSLPVVFTMRGEGLDADSGAPVMGGLHVTGIGDLAVEGKYRLYRRGGVKLAALAAVTLPSSVGSDGSQFLGDNLPALRTRVALQLDRGRFSVGANGGVLLRKPRTIYDSTIGPQLAWSAGAAVRVTQRFSLIGEGYGRAGLPDFSLDASPLEVIGGLRVYATSSMAVVAGGGAGLVRAIGSPQSRFFLSVGYAPDVRDSDGDGIPNGRDRCPLEPEDKDGFEDSDGCPDDDNDGDHRPDATDKCPNQAEDLDGFDDDDGCPDLDNDGDKIPDLEDKCPLDPEDGREPFPKDGCPANKRDSDGDGLTDDVDKCPLKEEDMDGFEDGDGCPEGDNDNDGVPDGEDRCPLCPEDKDGFEDGDGCPDLDNDHDGIPDAKDACPLEPETINGVKDDDGCPDTGGAQLVTLDGDRLVVDRVPTLAGGGKTLAPVGALVVDQMALVILGHDEVTKWLIALAQPSARDATRLAEAVTARLVAKGVPADRIHVLGAAGPAKIGGVVQERAEAAEPVCPAGREVRERPEAAKPKPAEPGPDARPAEPTPATDARPAAPKPAEPKPAAPKPATDAKPAEPKPAEPEIELE
ncbi:MAG TPA: thrombospondin type 3 repeat-containing protein [Kofleriaceae bacterium]|nr:thrombospondin type 3 repeat-containing protein [Kofleriaceae bacterium]